MYRRMKFDDRVDMKARTALKTRDLPGALSTIIPRIHRRPWYGDSGELSKADKLVYTILPPLLKMWKMMGLSAMLLLIITSIRPFAISWSLYDWKNSTGAGIMNPKVIYLEIQTVKMKVSITEQICV